LAVRRQTDGQQRLLLALREEVAIMKYMLLIYGDESQYPDDMDLTPWQAYTQEAMRAGVHRAGAGLMPVSTATTVRQREGRMLTTDGPFAETREQLGGFYILDCKDLDEAIAWASRIPSVGWGSVEIRPVMAGEA
jgi:hypothetical protein